MSGPIEVSTGEADRSLFAFLARRLGAQASSWRNWVRFVIYLALVLNTFYYFYLDGVTYAVLAAEAPLIQHVQTFATTIDYGGWLFLMIAFQLQTYWEYQSRISRKQLFWLVGLISAGAGCLFLALYLFVLDYEYYDHFAGFPSDQVCGLADAETYFLDDWQLYNELTSGNCGALSNTEVYRHGLEPTLISAQNLEEGIELAIIEVINAGVWIVLVALVQFGLLAERMWPQRTQLLRVVGRVKMLFYLVLVVDALYWLTYGLWVDAWDAFLWLFAVMAVQMKTSGPSSPEAAQSTPAHE